jgi:hypothetical protein
VVGGSGGITAMIDVLYRNVKRIEDGRKNEIC